MRSRRGVSLAELLIVMSLCSLLLTTSAVVLHRIMRSQLKTREFLSACHSSQRLADQFRGDVHRARSVTTEGLPEGAILKLQLSDTQIAEYQQANGVIHRMLVDGEKTIARDEFAFPANSHIAVSQQRSPPLVTLSVTSTPDDERGPAQQAYAVAIHLRVDAQPGRDRRFADVPRQSEEGSP